MAKLIELHTVQGKVLEINPDFIFKAEAQERGTRVDIFGLFLPNGPTIVTESLDELKELMRD